MRMIGKILVFALAAAGLAACRKPQPLDGPGMVYNFNEYELAGDWTELNGEGKIVFTRDEMTIDGVTQSYSAVQEDGRTRAVITAGDREYLFRRIEADGQDVNCLFDCGEDGEVLRVFVKDVYLGYLPEGWMPSLDEGEPAEYGKAAENLKRYVIAGEWQELGAQDPETLTFAETDDAYTVSGDGSVVTDTEELHCTRKIINGESVYFLYDETGRFFVRTDSLSLIPEGYVPDHGTDIALVHDGPVYAADDVTKLTEWLGKKPEETGVDEELIGDRTILFEGTLFGKKVIGRAVSAGHIYSIAVFSEELDYDAAVEALTALYGEGSPLDIPYLATDGTTDAVMFYPEKYRSVAVFRHSALRFIEIDFDYMVNTE